MNLKTFLKVALFSLPFALSAQAADVPRPKLIVAILVDQLRYDYLERFHDQFTPGGFRLLTDDGAFMTFARYNYCPTVTAPGHATVFSGAPPSMHGIIGNDWYDKRTRKTTYCVGDATVTGVGTTGSAGKMSPRNFVGSNFADELRLACRTKVVGVSIKDRGAILPAGKRPAGAFWFEASSGSFVTSSYYMRELPAWVRTFNERRRPAQFLGQTWDRLLEASQYEREDNVVGEGNMPGEKKPTFPHVIARPTPAPAKPAAGIVVGGVAITAMESRTAGVPALPSRSKMATPKPAAPKESYDNLLATPFSNQLLAEFARAAIEGEKLGEGAGPDLLTVSFSGVDACGHRFGPDSQEVQDIMLRLDRELTAFFSYLDQKFGLANVLLTMTADHGVMPTPEFAAQQGLDGQRADEMELMGDLLGRLSERFHSTNLLLVKSIFDGQLFFNHDALRDAHLTVTEVASFIREWALSTGKFQAAYSREQLLDGRSPGQLGEHVFNGFNAERSGDMVLVYKPFIIDSTGQTGTTHGSAYSYDTRIPVLFRGAAFRPGRYADEFYITDFVPTLCAALRLTEPAGSIGKPFVKVLADQAAPAGK